MTAPDNMSAHVFYDCVWCSFFWGGSQQSGKPLHFNALFGRTCQIAIGMISGLEFPSLSCNDIIRLSNARLS